jgi:alpha-amylase
VDNHDSQPLQALESYVEFWFRPMAYALILFREQGIPCVFYPDLYGATYTDEDKEGEEVEVTLPVLPCLAEMIKIRKELAYGLQREYFDFPNCIGWTREGMPEKEHSGLAVLMSNGAEGFKAMEMGIRHAGRIMVDVVGGRVEEVSVNEEGWAEFFCNGESLAVWVFKQE